MITKVEALTPQVVKNLNETIVVLDTETTGFSKYNDRIVEFGAIKMKKGKPVETKSFLINPGMRIPNRVIDVHGITNEMVADKPKETFYIQELKEFLSDCTYIVGHNISFDLGFLEEMYRRSGLPFECVSFDTLTFARKFFPNSPSFKLGELASYLGMPANVAHRALADVETTVYVLRKLACAALQPK